MSKENYCLRIMNAYSLIVNFDGDTPGANVSGPVDGEPAMLDQQMPQWRHYREMLQKTPLVNSMVALDAVFSR